MEKELVPYEAAEISGRRILALAAHPDDEVFGAGALLSRLAASAESVRVVVLTGGESQEETPSGAADPEIRRREARAAGAEIGVSDYVFLAFPDRGLTGLSEEIAAELRLRIVEFGPDLILAPSPAEIHPDHRALGTAVFEIIAASRPEDADHEIFRFLRIAYYEISLPFLPNALVPSGTHAEKKRLAMNRFESQASVRDYAGAMEGLNRYRALTLSGAPEAEAFRLLTARDASLTSVAAFCRQIAPSAIVRAGTQVAPADLVIRTKNRPELLREAVESVAAQTTRPGRLIIVNDGGTPVSLETFADTFAIEIVDLPQSVGRSAAANRGFDRVRTPVFGFLDDDDLLLPDHFERLLAARLRGPEPIVYSDTASVLLKPSDSGWSEAHRELQFSLDFDADYLMLANFIPLHTVLFDTALVKRVGRFDESLAYSEDWDLLIRLSFEAPMRHLRAVTCLYRIFENEAGHAAAGSTPFLEARRTILDRYASRRDSELPVRVLDRLARRLWHTQLRETDVAREIEHHRDSSRQVEQSSRKMAGDLREVREEVRRTIGERDGLASHLEAANGRIGEFGGRIGELEGRVEALLDSNAGYAAIVPLLRAEIERLGNLVTEMEGTRAWRLHRFVHSLRGH